MIHQRIFWGLALLCLVTVAQADDLYQVTVKNKRDAAILRSTGVDGVVRLSDGFLVLADSSAVSYLALTGLPAQLIMSAVGRDELGLEIEHGNRASGQAATSDEQKGARVVRLPKGPRRIGIAEPSVLLLADEHVPIEFLESRYTAEQMLSRLGQASIPLEELISRVSRDSLESYEHTLATFYPRYPGFQTNNQARDWLAAKLASFGMDSISVDSFGSINECGPLPAFNVIGYKFGHKFPKHYVIVGAHRDARDTYPVTGQFSPGADDNGSGTVAVLEMARILANVETDMTIVFALFDAEEQGLFGSKYYSRGARARGDSIVCMLNLDMIGDINNNTGARIYRGQQTGVANLLGALADSLLFMTCEFEAQGAGSDHFPFDQAGYEIAGLIEFNFSSVYHSINDDTTHIGWDYLTKMTQASLATVYTVNATAWPSPTLAFRFPYGVPTMTSPVKTTSFEVSFSSVSGGVRVPGSERLCYSIEDSPCVAIPLTPISSQLFRATLPTSPCGTRFRFYVKADEASRGTLTDIDTTTGHFALSAGRTEIVFKDNFETDKGWVVTGSAATSREGMWERGYPADGGSHGDPTHDFDSSGQCYLTGNGYYFEGSSLVHNSTMLSSPLIGLPAKPAIIRFAACYSNSYIHSPTNPYFIPHQDVFGVFVSSDGENWTLRQTIGPVWRADGGWYTYSLPIEILADGSLNVQFVAQDQAHISCIEAAIDAFEVIAYDCASPPSCCTGVAGNVNMAGVIDLADLSALISYLTGGGYVLPCTDAANVNGFGIVDLGDLSALVNYLTGGGYVLPSCQ